MSQGTMSESAGCPHIIVVQAPTLKRSYETYASSAVFILGWVQVFTGVTSIALGIANPLTCGLYGMIGYGIWGGCLYVTAGVFGIFSSMRRTSPLIISHLTLSVISAGVAAIQLALGVVSAYYNRLGEEYSCLFYTVANQDRINNRGAVAVDALLASFGIIEGIVAIVAAAYSCRVMCCNSHFRAATHVESGQGHTGGLQGLPPGAVVYYASAGVPGGEKKHHSFFNTSYS